MTASAEWVAVRAEEWAQWIEKAAVGGNGFRSSSVLADYVGGDRGAALDFSVFDEARCVAFDAAVGALPTHLRIVFRVHWLGSERLTAAAPATEKAAVCAVSRAGYYRRLEEANDALFAALR